ncbi:MAG: 50S ribosomal protein L9 [Limisphaerales bacterium]
MPKVQIILTQNVVNLGAESDQVKVAAGFARNYLFPQRLAIPLTAANKRRLEALRQKRADREARELNTMTELAKTLSKLTLSIIVKTGDEERMFGSVTAGTIADELKHQFDVALDKKKIHLEKPLRTLGAHEVELRLHPDVVTLLKVRVAGATSLSVPAEIPAAEVKPVAAGRSEPKKDRPARKPKPESKPTPA